jgi:hypothetical protein
MRRRGGLGRFERGTWAMRRRGGLGRFAQRRARAHTNTKPGLGRWGVGGLGDLSVGHAGDLGDSASGGLGRFAFTSHEARCTHTHTPIHTQTGERGRVGRFRGGGLRGGEGTGAILSVGNLADSEGEGLGRFGGWGDLGDSEGGGDSSAPPPLTYKQTSPFAGGAPHSGAPAASGIFASLCSCARALHTHAHTHTRGTRAIGGAGDLGDAAAQGTLVMRRRDLQAGAMRRRGGLGRFA